MLPFQTKAQQNKGQLYIQEKEIIQKDNTLRIHLLIDAREIKVNSATTLELIPELFDEELHTLALPKIVLNGRKRHRIEKKESKYSTCPIAAGRTYIPLYNPKQILQ